MKRELNSNLFRLTFIIFSVFFLFTHLSLCFGDSGWGKTGHVIECQGTNLDEFYYDMNGLNFFASIPNYQGTFALENDHIYVYGLIDEIEYDIRIPYFATLEGSSSAEFIAAVTEGNPESRIIEIDPENFGVKCVVDLIPLNKDDLLFIRMFYTGNRVIWFYTVDPNPNNRQYFFDSFRLIKS